MNENNPYQPGAAPEKSAFEQAPAHGDATGGVIPYKNVPALIGYYTGIFSLLPCIGFPLGFVAVVLGVIGLMKKSKQPEVKGSAHAIVAIVCGTISIVVYGAGLVLMLIGMSAGP